MPVRSELVQILADGAFHSGQALSARLAMSRGRVRKQVRGLAALGLAVEAMRGRGYRLAQPVELLERGAILDQLDQRSRGLLSGLDIFTSIDSTSNYLALAAGQGAPSGLCCLAEHQRAGRGRRGRHWVSPFGANIYLSLLWRFSASPSDLGGLSLVIGIAVAEALSAAGIRAVGLKWPNDVLWHGRKLAGILIDLAGESTGPSYAVVGVGLNIRMPASAGSAIEQPWIDVYSILGRAYSRNRLAGLLLHHLLLATERFARDGLKSFLAEWSRLDVIAGKPVALRLSDTTVTGMVQGVTLHGELILVSGGVVRTYSSGEVSLRLLA